MRTPEEIADRVAKRLSSEIDQIDIQVNVRPDGDLEISANEAARQWLQEQKDEDRYSEQVLYEALEGYACNGGFEPFDASQGNPDVGLTSAPCIAEAITIEDDGTRVIDGRYWYYHAYAIHDPVDVLRQTGFVTFTLAT